MIDCVRHPMPAQGIPRGSTPVQTQDSNLAATVQVVQAFAEAIRELSPVPSGEFYAHVCGKVTFDQFTRIIDILVRTNLVRRKDTHILEWTGPQRASKQTVLSGR